MRIERDHRRHSQRMSTRDIYLDYADGYFRYGPITVPLQDQMEIRDELLKAIIEVFTIRKASPETWRGISGRAALDHSDDFPKGIRIGCDQNTNQPIFEFESENVEKRFLEHLRRICNPAPEPSAIEASEAGREPDGFEHKVVEPLQAMPIEESDSQAQAHQGPAETEPSVATFSFADLLDQTRGKWSSINLKDLDIKFAVSSQPGCLDLWLIHRRLQSACNNAPGSG
jgi:hypothetical protein